MRHAGRWSDAGLNDFRGAMQCLRPFGFPGRIDSFERVWLTFAGLDGLAVVTLNDQHLGSIEGAQGPAEFEITTLLRPRNVLAVQVEAQQPDGGLWGEVALEIRSTAFLCNVRFDLQAGQLTATGLVVGTASRPLDIYLLAGGRFLSHSHIDPASSGQPFTLTGTLEDISSSSPLPVRVELIDAATVWYVVHGNLQAI